MNVKKLSEFAVLPVRGTQYAAGNELYTGINIFMLVESKNNVLYLKYQASI